MKTLIVKENVHGRKTTLNAKSTHQTDSGKWIAEVNKQDLNHACVVLCEGIEGCRCDNLHVEADQDDDGKEYSLLGK